jgi:hypothetical protein
VKEWIAVVKAADAAARGTFINAGREFAQEPSVNHPLEVASLVAEATDGSDPDLANRCFPSRCH